MASRGRRSEAADAPAKRRGARHARARRISGRSEAQDGKRRLSCLARNDRSGVPERPAAWGGLSGEAKSKYAVASDAAGVMCAMEMKGQGAWSLFRTLEVFAMANRLLPPDRRIPTPRFRSTMKEVPSAWSATKREQGMRQENVTSARRRSAQTEMPPPFKGRHRRKR